MENRITYHQQSAFSYVTLIESVLDRLPSEAGENGACDAAAVGVSGEGGCLLHCSVRKVSRCQEEQ